MPQFPRYESQKNITTGAAPMRQGAGQEEQQNAQLANVAQDITIKWAKAIDTMQYTTAKANFESGIADIKNRAIADPDFNNSGKYYDEIEKLRKSSLEGFSNKAVQDNTTIEFSFGANIAKAEIDNTFRKKTIINNAFELNRGVEALLEKIVTSPTDKAAKQARDEMIGLVEANIVNGTIQPEDGQKLINATLQSAVEYEIYNDQSTTEETSQVLASLKAGKKGKFDYLTADERLDAIKTSQTRIYYNNQRYKKSIDEIQEVRIRAIDQKIFDDTLTIADIDKEANIPIEEGGLGKDYLNNLKDKLYKSQIQTLNVLLDENPESEKYQKLISKFIDDKTDKILARQILIDAYYDGILSKEEKATLNKMQETLHQIEINRTKTPVSAIKNLVNFFKGNKLSDEQLTIKLRQLIASGVDNMPIVSETLIQQEKNKNNPYNFEINNTYNGPKGSFIVVGFQDNGTPLIQKVTNVKREDK